MWTEARRRCDRNLLQSSLDVQRREGKATVLATSGGSAGMMEFASTGMLYMLNLLKLQFVLLTATNRLI